MSVAIGLAIFGGGFVILATSAQSAAETAAAQTAPVEGYLDTTNLGFTEAHYYEVHTPDGTIPCIVTESTEHGAGAGVDCNWEDIQP